MATAIQAPTTTGPGSYNCSKCGHDLRVFGRGRHRIYFETADERLVDPVMDSACPGCGQGLPGKTGASGS